MKHPDRHEDRQPRTPGCRRGEPAPPDERWCLRAPACPRHISLITLPCEASDKWRRAGRSSQDGDAATPPWGRTDPGRGSFCAVSQSIGRGCAFREFPRSEVESWVLSAHVGVWTSPREALPPQLNPPTLSLSPLSSRRALISHRRAPWAPRSSSVLAPSLSSRRFPGRHANLPTPRPWLYQSFDGQI